MGHNNTEATWFDIVLLRDGQDSLEEKKVGQEKKMHIFTSGKVATYNLGIVILGYRICSIFLVVVFKGHN